eukprot:CAMPEP_0115536032 /NCGR_PEP_ID=MMETSP0271-20121206/87561_1 /TAXON_ID=71861 /ORGANISM="Scrippsiella trochoidea, Strain CCMP3099" /LENGTH=170 /DNA_ID=CAMNT_0002968699 /DNA_START=55 /DNA_END=567 /DNA_ORIENTATION=+
MTVAAMRIRCPMNAHRGLPCVVLGTWCMYLGAVSFDWIIWSLASMITLTVITYMLLLMYCVCLLREPGEEPESAEISENAWQERRRREKQNLYDLAFPAILIDEEGSPDPEDLCIVCLEAKAAGESCRTLNCRHSFHAPCIDGWWMQNKQAELSCPMCRQRDAKTITVSV